MLSLIRSDLARMRELDAKAHDAESFPVDPQASICTWCEFQEICPAVKRSPIHVLPRSTGAPSETSA
jgi:hypothetical protein